MWFVVGVAEVNVKNIAPKSTNKPMREIALLLKNTGPVLCFYLGAHGFSSKSAANLVVDISTKHISRAPVKSWWVGG